MSASPTTWTASPAVRAQHYRDLAARCSARVHLQGIGKVPAIPAGDLVLGDERACNYASTARAVAIEAKGKASLVITWVADQGRQYQRMHRIAGLVPLVDRPDAVLYPAPPLD